MPLEKIPRGNWLLLTGILLAILGLAAILSPSVAGGAVVYVIGGFLVLTGVVQLLAGWRADSFTSKLTNIVQGAIGIVAGIAVLAHPFYGLAALSLVLAVFFLIDGFWKIVNSFAYRPAAGWLAVLASGLIAVALSWMIWSQWPVSGLWAVGILVGVDLLSTGLALITLALTWKKAVRTVKEKSELIKEKIAETVSEAKSRN
jgi:uncharacterized membrane protein HdeD (DUF308 family)